MKKNITRDYLIDLIRDMADEYLIHGTDHYIGVNPKQRILAARVNTVLLDNDKNPEILDD